MNGSIYTRSQPVKRFSLVVVAMALLATTSSVLVANAAHATVTSDSAIAQGAAHATGAIFSTERVPATSRQSMAMASSLPATVDLTAWAVPVGDQGNVESCT